MATKKAINGIKHQNAHDFIGDLHDVLKKYNLDYGHATLTLDQGELSLTKGSNLNCDPGCTVRYEVIILPGGARKLRPYCDCS